MGSVIARERLEEITNDAQKLGALKFTNFLNDKMPELISEFEKEIDGKKDKHIVGMYFNEATCQFSLTAREADNPDLPAMHKSEKERGFEFKIIREQLDKETALSYRNVVQTVLAMMNYEHVIRPKLNR